MTQQEKEKMFLDLNSVLVKFWIEQGRPDKEIKIELLERMLNWQKKAGIVIPDEQSKEPVSEDLEEAAEDGARQFYVTGGYSPFPHIECGAYKSGFISGAEWQAERLLKGSPMPEDTVIFQKGIEEGKRLMMEDAVEGYIALTLTGQPTIAALLNDKEFTPNDKVKIVIVKED